MVSLGPEDTVLTQSFLIHNHFPPRLICMLLVNKKELKVDDFLIKVNPIITESALPNTTQEV